jgi:hypothetical protein
MVKKARGNKIKVIFQRLHITNVIFALLYNLNFIFWIHSITLHVKYKYVLIIN